MRYHLMLEGRDYSKWTELPPPTNAKHKRGSIIVPLSTLFGPEEPALGIPSASYAGKFETVRMCGVIREIRDIAITAFDNRCGVGDNDFSERTSDLSSPWDIYT
jgi:hypothetical protein